MSRAVQQSIFFLGLPDLRKLCCLILSLQEDEVELRSKQIKTCRELVLLHSDILASPALDSFTEITVVMDTSFYQKGIVQLFALRRGLQVGSPQCVFPGVLQCCLSYSLITRLSPSWNKAGLYLINGKDFLSETGRLNAVSMELKTCEGQLCFSVEANTVRLPPTTLEDFDLPPLVLRRFCSDPDSVLDPTSTGGAVWCHVLPSMKKGQIITISRKLPQDGPFRTYRDLQSHWSCLYGYRLPDLAEEEAVYCSVHFRLVGERLFTYPLSCIRLQPLQCCPRVDLQGALGSFLSDVRAGLQSVCGFPARLTSKPRYVTVGLNTAATAQVLSGEKVNLSSSSSVRQILTQLPPPPPRPCRTKCWSQPPASTPLSQRDAAQWLLGNGYRNGLTQSQVCRGEGDWPSSTSSSSSVSWGYRPASCLTTFSSVLSPLPPPCQTPLVLSPKLVPIFKNNNPSRHVNVALLRVQKQEHMIKEDMERGRVMPPAFRKNTPAAASSCSVSSLSTLLIGLPPPVPHFAHRHKPRGSAAPPTSALPNVKHVRSLSPTSRSKPAIILVPKVEIKFKSKSCLKPSMKQSSESRTTETSSGEGQEQPSPAASLTSSETKDPTASCSKKQVRFESKVKKSRSAVKDVDVEKMARSNQLSKLNSVTLLAWLRGRGKLISVKHKKEELILKVMASLAEA